MTIYTDPVTGKQYRRVPGGMKSEAGPVEGYVGCRECAFHDADKHGKEVVRAIEYCVSQTTDKTVFFVFKERKA